MTITQDRAISDALRTIRDNAAALAANPSVPMQLQQQMAVAARAAVADIRRVQPRLVGEGV